ncbi:T9SS type A sorting domain-containing protein [Panacibacter ginsenosidivorans]|uniref:T9SS type A sorting domain-containing protein n=1 Tax=Panacibacter ginsenosidivorans TaxID=1813871 RepID=A0A5B8V2Y4_9BACT|nr:T9SS type A sorting domain-containing protein [Panacibacter ginsenosidivorans]QEC65877.1 T9SS type A sorting domain-containing protein [Panacibacter ginsenosidivorans]
MKTKSTLFVVSFILLLSKFSANAQCTVTITGKKELGSPLKAKTGDCHVEMLTWQLNGETVYVAYQTQFRRKGTVVAGGNAYGSASNQLAAPGDVYVDDAGNVYVLDGNNNRVQKWAPGATVGETVAGGHGLGSAANQFFLPQGFFVDKMGNIYVADLFNNRVQKWALGATTGETVAGGNGYGSGANQLASPKDVFVDAVGNVFVTDADNNRVQRWAPGATMGVTVAGGNGYGSNANQLKNPFSLFVDETGSVYISDRTNNRIQKWAAGASSGVTVAAGTNGSGEDSSQLNDPRGLFVDSYGRMYISDYFNNRIQKWVPGMEYGVTIAGGRGVGETPGKLNHPSGVYMSGNGDLYVTDEGNNRVEKYSGFNFIKDRFIPTVAGKYRVIAVCSNGLIDTSAEVEIGMDLALQAVPSVETAVIKNDNVVTIFPNPALEYTTLKYTTSKQGKIVVQITDISGKVVIRNAYTSIKGENQLKIDVSNLARGNYIVCIINGDTSQTAKLNKL